MQNKEHHQPIAIRQSKIEAYAAKIERSWHKALESIFAVGDLINEAKKELTENEYSTLIGSENLPFGARVAERLAAIASDKRLRSASLQKHLPPCWTTLDVLHRFSDKQFQEAKTQKLISGSLTRQDAISFWKELQEGRRSNSTTKKPLVSAAHRPNADKAPTLIFEVPADLENHKALLDVYFICDLATLLFGSTTDKSNIQVSREGSKPSKKMLGSREALVQLIGQIRKVENFERAKRGKAPLTKVQEILSLLGADPDSLGDFGFSLMERIALSYARRHGIDCIKEEQLKWFASKNGTEPELLGSFLEDVEKRVGSMLS